MILNEILDVNEKKKKKSLFGDVPDVITYEKELPALTPDIMDEVVESLDESPVVNEPVIKKKSLFGDVPDVIVYENQATKVNEQQKPKKKKAKIEEDVFSWD